MMDHPVPRKPQNAAPYLPAKSSWRKKPPFLFSIKSHQKKKKLPILDFFSPNKNVDAYVKILIFQNNQLQTKNSALLTHTSHSLALQFWEWPSAIYSILQMVHGILAKTGLTQVQM